MALKKCLKRQCIQLKQSSITKNHLFLIKVGKRYIDNLDGNLTLIHPRRMGKTFINRELHRYGKLGSILKTSVHYRHGLKQFSTKGL